MPKISPEIVTALEAFLAQNIERIKQRKKGEPERLKGEFETQTGFHITMSYYTNTAIRYRKQRGITMELADNKYYKPQSDLELFKLNILYIFVIRIKYKCH
jgi:hypothetical protein